MGSVKNFLLGLVSDTKSKLIVACASAIILLFLLNRWNYNRFQDAKEEAQRIEQNLYAAQDTIRTTRAKNNELEYDKRIYVASSKKELKALSDSLAKQVDITKGDVSVIANVGFKVKHDTIQIPTAVYIQDSIISLRSRIDTNYSVGNFRSLAFESVYDERLGKAHSTILEDKIGFTATVGVKQNEKKQYEIFVRPHYPGMEVGQLEGAIIKDDLFKTETKTKVPLVTIGGNIGWVPFTYDLNTQKSSVNLNRLGVSVGLNFNLGAILK